MKKLLHLAYLGAIACAAGTAHARIADGTARGASELFLSVVDEAAQVSYVRDLGVTYDEFMADTGAFLSFAPDANWTSFLTLVGGTSNLVYTVAGMNLQGGTLNRYLSTTNSDMTISSNRPANSLLGTSFPSVNIYVQQSNLLTADRNQSTHGTDVSVDGSNIAFGDPSLPEGADGDAYFGNGQTRRWGLAQTPFDTTEFVGTALSFYEIRRSGTNAVLRSAADLMPGQWLLAANGTLTYGTPPIPEPETWALMLAGAALVGVAARRRRG